MGGFFLARHALLSAGTAAKPTGEHGRDGSAGADDDHVAVLEPQGLQREAAAAEHHARAEPQRRHEPRQAARQQEAGAAAGRR